MDKVVNIVDVAKKAGVVKSTVSNVLTGKKYVSPSLRKKVLDACEELDYHPNFYASALSSKKSSIIALLLENSDDIEQKMYKNLIVACIKEASLKGYSLLVYYNSDREKLLETLRKGCAPIDGALIMSPCLNDERMTQFDSQHTSFVVIGRPENLSSISYIDVNNYELTKKTTLKLIELTCSKNIYLVNSSEEMTISQDRAHGFIDAVEESGFHSTDRIIPRTAFFDEDNTDVYDLIEKDSIFLTCDDIVAQKIYMIAKEKELLVGKDVSVFALGRSKDTGTFDPPLSYAKQDYALIGQTAVNALISLIDEETEKKQVLIDNEIVIGKSVNIINK